MVKVTRSNIAEHLLEYQLNLINKTVKDALAVHDWKDYWTFTQKDAENLKAYAIPLIKKVFKCNKKKAEDTFDYFLLNFGLKIHSSGRRL